MFNILAGILGVLMHPVVTVRAWWDTLREQDSGKPAEEDFSHLDREY
jgi:hypothetical protein